jgi:hypothetical protein
LGLAGKHFLDQPQRFFKTPERRTEEITRTNQIYGGFIMA